MLVKDARRNSGSLPARQIRVDVINGVWVAADRWLERLPGTKLDRFTACMYEALVTARIATEVTGNIYRVHSGRYRRRIGFREVQLTGTRRDFHCWVMCGYPDRRMELVDAQGAMWEPPELIWDWVEELLARRDFYWVSNASVTRARLREAEQGNREGLLLALEGAYQVAWNWIEGQGELRRPSEYERHPDWPGIDPDERLLALLGALRGQEFEAAVDALAGVN
jgi:hypothetical protein